MNYNIGDLIIVYDDKTNSIINVGYVLLAKYNYWIAKWILIECWSQEMILESFWSLEDNFDYKIEKCCHNSIEE